MMKFLKKFPLVLIIYCLVNTGYAIEYPYSGSIDERPSNAPVDGLIVKFKDQAIVAYQKNGNLEQAAKQQAQVLSRQLGVALKLDRLLSGDAFLLDREQPLTQAEAQDLSAKISARPDVEYAEPNAIMQIQLTPNDSRYSDQWHYFEATGGINAPLAWDISTGQNVIVAVIDTGYRPHADLNANILPGYDFISNATRANDGGGRDADARDPGDWVVANECYFGSTARDSSWHGTHVAGTVAALTNNNTGVAGVAFDSRVLPVRVLGKCGGTLADIADGIRWSAGLAVPGVPNNANPAQVINMSLGGSGSCGTTYTNAINAARTAGATVVVAAGNSNSDASGFRPANCNGVITVAATDRAGNKAYYSNFGNAVDLAAPGGETPGNNTNGVLSTLNSGTTTPVADNYVYYQGTSMAAPHVAGVAALLYGLDATITPDDVEAILTSTTRTFPGVCADCGTGILNALSAVSSIAPDTFEPWMIPILNYLLESS